MCQQAHFEDCFSEKIKFKHMPAILNLRWQRQEDHMLHAQGYPCSWDFCLKKKSKLGVVAYTFSASTQESDTQGFPFSPRWLQSSIWNLTLIINQMFIDGGGWGAHTRQREEQMTFIKESGVCVCCGVCVYVLCVCATVCVLCVYVCMCCVYCLCVLCCDVYVSAVFSPNFLFTGYLF